MLALIGNRMSRRGRQRTVRYEAMIKYTEERYLERLNELHVRLTREIAELETEAS